MEQYSMHLLLRVSRLHAEKRLKFPDPAAGIGFGNYRGNGAQGVCAGGDHVRRVIARYAPDHDNRDIEFSSDLPD
jgi:hypothetical protein